MTCHVDGPDQLWVRADRALLHAIWTNLVSNALSYTPRAGSVEARAWIEGAVAVLELANTTHGLEQHDLDHMFEPLWRKEASRSEGDHHGLGLSLVKFYSKLLGARLTADLPRPDWLRVRLELPVLQKEGGGAREAVEPSGVMEL